MNTPRTSALITWLGRIGITCLIAVPLSVAAVRFQVVHFSAGLLVFGLSCLIALVVMLALAIISFLPKFTAERNRALKLSLFALPPVLLLGALGGSGGDYPAIHDITTNTDDPPVFVQGVAQRGEDSNSIAIKPDVITLQLEHYPDLAPLASKLDAQSAHARALEVGESLGWVVYNSDPEKGLIEASYTSFWFGFVDDIVIRVRATNEGSLLDLRSVSRVGVSDLGANAKRIRAFVDRFPG